MLLVDKIQNFIKSYLAFEVPEITLPLALWAIGTHCFESFDSFAYLVITSHTKRSGKTRLSEILSFCASNPMNFSAMTPSTLFRVINPVAEKIYTEDEPFIPPTIVFDEAESLSSESAGTMRSVLNAGYRKGQTVPRTVGQDVVMFKVFCPKVFILIGDVYDTLRDRSIIVNMLRAEAPKRFSWDAAEREGSALRREIKALLTPDLKEQIVQRYHSESASFLSDRDEEIWLPLIALCHLIAPERVRDLRRVAVDMATMKTAEKKAYKTLDLFETKHEQAEYAERAAKDIFTVIGERKAMSSADAVEGMKALDLSPWRTYQGKGLSQHSLGDLLSQAGIYACNVRFGEKVLKSYRRVDIERIAKSLQAKIK